MKIKCSIRRILAVAYLESRWIKRQPLWIAQGFIGSIGFIFILFAWGSLEALKNLIVAYIIAGSWGLGLNIIGQLIGWSRISRDYERMVASPVSLYEYFLGITLAMFPFLVPSLVLALVLTVIVGISMFKFLMLVILSIPAMIIGTFLSLAIILRIKNPMNISAITNPLATFTTVLPPVYYPLSVVPEYFRLPCLLIPTTAMSELGRILLIGSSCVSQDLCILIIVAWLIITAIAVKHRLKWGLE